jgi:hypothetical protein
MMKNYKAAFPFLFLLPLSVALLGLDSVNKQNPEPNLMDSCRTECPQSKTNESVLVCFDQLEKAIGDNGMMQSHSGCYKAIESYQKISKAEEEPQEIDRTG